MKIVLFVILLTFVLACSSFGAASTDVGIYQYKDNPNPVYAAGMSLFDISGLNVRGTAEFTQIANVDVRRYSATIGYYADNNIKGWNNAQFFFGGGGYWGDNLDYDGVKAGGFVGIRLGLLDGVYFETKYTDVLDSKMFDGLQCGILFKF